MFQHVYDMVTYPYIYIYIYIYIYLTFCVYVVYKSLNFNQYNVIYYKTHPILVKIETLMSIKVHTTF